MSSPLHCSQCHSPFSITDEDRALMEAVSPKVAGKTLLIPLPTLCAECRLQRRLAHRNERKLYKRKDDAGGKMIVAGYPPDTPFPVFSPSAWWGDSWDPLSFGRDTDLSRSFMEQWQELRMVVPRMAFQQERNENSEYTNNVSNLKDCYLLFSADFSRSCSYGTWIQYCQDCVENTQIVRCERTHDCLFCDNVYATTGAVFCSQCHSSAFLFDCRNCSDCFQCWNLRGKRHCIRNNQYSKEEYERLRADIDLSSFQTYEGNRREFLEHVRDDALHPPVWKRGTILDATGDMLCDAAQCRNCFQAVDAKDCSNVFAAMKIRNIVDSNHVSGEFAYEECECFPTPVNSAFNLNTYSGSSLYYCDLCMNTCQDCFGCVGLKHSRYCILNKQYTKEEYETLLPKIIDRMTKDKEWGEFLPHRFSVVSYNESQAAELFPLAKPDVESRGWRWRDGEEEPQPVTKTIAAAELPDTLDDIPDDILNWAIFCDATSRPFKVIKQELEFYRTMRLPIPRLHPDERHQRRTAIGNPRKLWNRECAKCGKGMETTYSSERKEKICCEECYLKEVY
ncbi:MAG: hypothetical protein PHZ00_07290 [Candidatus Peribacteraceae bacterium]|nr:hypothetical protein [Candidatus Peribacteraceae bacterium]